MAAKRNGRARGNGNGKTDVTLADLAREMRAGFGTLGDRVDALGTRFDDLGTHFEELGTRFDELGDRVDGLGTRVDELGGRVDALGNRLERHHEELIAEIAKGHGLESRVSKLEAAYSRVKRKRR